MEHVMEHEWSVKCPSCGSAHHGAYEGPCLDMYQFGEGASAEPNILRGEG